MLAILAALVEDCSEAILSAAMQSSQMIKGKLTKPICASLRPEYEAGGGGGGGRGGEGGDELATGGGELALGGGGLYPLGGGLL